jgi:hypothetical protein
VGSAINGGANEQLHLVNHQRTFNGESLAASSIA